MEQTIQLAKSGWSEGETERLWDEIRQAADTGVPLRGVFERMGRELGRKPNSIRNYYYMQLRGRGGESFRRAVPFQTFTREEIDSLLRAVLIARGRGQSVRACVSDMANGDHSLMLRYQNKYRAILRKRPEWIESVAETLRAEGYACPEISRAEETETDAARAAIAEKARATGDRDVQRALMALDALIDRVTQTNRAEAADKLRVRCDLVMIKLDDLRLAARDMLAVCKEFIGSPADVRVRALDGFCEALSARVTALENAAN